MILLDFEEPIGILQEQLQKALEIGEKTGVDMSSATTELEKKIIQIIHDLANEKGYVCSVDVLIRLNYLTKTDYENWRFGRVEYLEKVCRVSLGKLTTINRLIRQISAKANLKSSWTAYNKYGKGAKIRLRFCKSGNENIEKLYATHYISEYVMRKMKQNKEDEKSTIPIEDVYETKDSDVQARQETR